MTSSGFSLSSGGMKVALGSIVGAGLAYIAYQSMRPKHPTKLKLVQEINARTTMGWQLRGMRVMVAIDNNTSPPSTPSPLCSSGELEGRDVVRAVQAPEPATRTSKADMLDDRPRDLILFLLSAGANVTLVARSSEVGRELREKVQSGNLEHWDRTLGLSDVSLHEWDFVLYQCNACEPAFVADLLQLCRKKRISLNILDCPELSDFSIDLRTDKMEHQRPTEAPCVISLPHALAVSTDGYVADIDATDVVEEPTVMIGVFDGYAVARYPCQNNTSE